MRGSSDHGQDGWPPLGRCDVVEGYIREGKEYARKKKKADDVDHMKSKPRPPAKAGLGHPRNGMKRASSSFHATWCWCWWE